MKIEAAKAIILWDHSEICGGMIHDVHVFHIKDQPHWARHLPASAGACNLGWLKGDWYETPLGVFTSLATMGFRNHAERVRALREFQKIQGEPWPAGLLLSLGEVVEEHDERAA